MDSLRPPIMGAFRLRKPGWRAQVKRQLIRWLYEHGYILALRGPLAAEQFSTETLSICRRVAAYTMTPPERVSVLIDAVNYVARQGVPGAMVECGVWRGGSMMAIALALLAREDERDLYLFDTYEGLTAPTERDVDLAGRSQVDLWSAEDRGAVAALTEVQRALATTGYSAGRLHFVKGKVEDTLPDQAPETIALLRLDTDWYESTKHELETLYARLVPGGILMIDDYGHFRGAQEAVDEYFGDSGPFLARIDYAARVAIKPPQAEPNRVARRR